MGPFDDNAWIGWLLAAAVLGCLEMLTADFTLLMVAVGACLLYTSPSPRD